MLNMRNNKNNREINEMVRRKQNTDKSTKLNLLLGSTHKTDNSLTRFLRKKRHILSSLGERHNYRLRYWRYYKQFYASKCENLDITANTTYYN